MTDDPVEDCSKDCPNVERCPMFPLFTQQMILNIYKRSYCHADYATCARFASMRSGTPPPPTLLPDGKTLEA